MDPRDTSQYVYVKHQNGAVSRLLKPESYLNRQFAQARTPPGQMFSAVVFEPSVRARADPDAIYGLLNVAGCFPSEEEAVEFIRERLQGDEDRTEEYLVMQAGRFCALSTAPAALCSQELVNTTERLHGEYGDAMDSRRKHDLIETTRKAERARKEAEDAQKKKAEESAKRALESNTLHAYTQLRVTRASQLCAARHMRKIAETAVQRAEEFEVRARELETRMRSMDPEYAEKYLGLYTDELANCGAALKDDDEECDANYVFFEDEPRQSISTIVEDKIRKAGSKQAHEIE